jgi:tight adherence protein B
MTLPPVLLAAAAAALLTAVPRPGPARLAGLRTDVEAERSRWPGWSPLLMAPLAALLLAGPVAAALVAGAVVLAQRTRADRRRAAALARERTTALDALSLLGAELRSGRPPGDALASAASVTVGATRGALWAGTAAARLGGDVPASLTSAGSAVPEVLRGLSACWEVCSTTGSGLATGVERLEEGLRAAEEQRRAVAAELAGPRSTAFLLAVLPVAGIGLAAALGAHPLHVLLHTPIGLVCLTGGLLLDGAGLLWTRRLVAAAVGGS